MEKSYIDDRILDFRKEPVKLPDNFQFIFMRNMMLACGDGTKGERDVSDIEFYTSQKVVININVFCCSYDYNPAGLKINTDYLTANPELNIVLCLFNLENSHEVKKLNTLFFDSIDNLGTDDARFYIPAHITYKIMKIDGNIHSVDTRVNKKEKSQIDLEYKNPELFIITDIELNNYIKTYRFQFSPILHRTPNKEELVIMHRKSSEKIILDAITKDAGILDTRILDFRRKSIQIPEEFSSVPIRNMMLACGDESDYGLCDIQFYTDVSYRKRRKIDVDINIFCCSYDYNNTGLMKNILS
jgi:hypothetical protein